MEPVSTSAWSVRARSVDGPTHWSAIRIADRVRSGEVSAAEVVTAHLTHIAETEPDVHALLGVDAEQALRRARTLDLRRRRGGRLGPLAGVPFVVKDNIDVRRQTTSCGSLAHEGVVALRSAPAVTRLIEAGAVLLGRANMDELAMGASTRTSAYGPTRNPWDVRRSPGGSSGGSAAAVAANLAAIALGTDTGGSIREPAAQCGVVGMAPSPGLVPMTGIVPFAPGLDRAGPLTRTVADAKAVLAVLAGRRELATADVTSLRVGLVVELSGPSNRPGVGHRLEATLNALTALGIVVVPVAVPDSRHGLGAYMDLTSAACVPLLERYVRTGQAGAEVVRRWELGRALATDDLAAAHAVRDRLGVQTRSALTECDVLLSPTMPTTAPLLSEVSTDDLSDPLAAPYTDCWTVVANLAGLPALSLPAGLSEDDGMPVGMMLSGAPGSDGVLLALAAALEGLLH